MAGRRRLIFLSISVGLRSPRSLSVYQASCLSSSVNPYASSTAALKAVYLFWAGGFCRKSSNFSICLVFRPVQAWLNFVSSVVMFFVVNWDSSIKNHAFVLVGAKSGIFTETASTAGVGACCG